MTMASASEHFQPRKTTLVPPDTTFVWLDIQSKDYEDLKQYFCNKALSSQDKWVFYDNKDECSHFIKQIDSKHNIVFISSGRLVTDIISDLHDLSQIHSIYIYCRKKEKYEALKNNYNKLRDVFDNPVELYEKLCDNLDDEVRRSLSNISISNDAVPIQKSGDIKLHCLFQNRIKTYYKPNIRWCPWQTNSCTVSLPVKGQGTIELWLKERILFELSLSNKQNPNVNDTNSYTIVLKVDEREAQLSTISAQHGHVSCIRDSATELHQVLQLEDDYWHCYWFTFYGADRMAQYGIDEIRPKFKILEAQLPECDKPFIESIKYLHIRINNSRDIDAMKNLQDKMRIFIGKEPVVFEPPLRIISPNEFSPIHPENYNGVFAPMLENPFRNLYHEIMKFTLNDEIFPNLIQTIEHSIKNPNGWCHQKLNEKKQQLERLKAETNYLCILVDKLETDTIKHSWLIKIWPPGHYSPVQNHNDAYGIIRVLYGKLLLKFFPVLSTKLHPNLLFEQIFEENEVTWMMPKLNQTYEMKNPDMYGSCCIVIQCYQYEIDDQIHHENFDDKANNKHRSKDCDSIPDNNYLAFRKTMMMESIPETAV